MSAIEAIYPVGHERVQVLRINPLEDFADNKFKKRYRMSKESFRELLLQLPNLQPKNTNPHSLMASTKLLLALRFYASGSFHAMCSDHINSGESTASKNLHSVTAEIGNLMNQYIRFPETQEELRKEKGGFYGFCNFPDVIQCIDCTHVRIVPRNIVNKERYRNRKGYYSINVQAVCNSRLQIANIVCRWPGPTHDACIFDNCVLKDIFVDGGMNCILLGDNGYMLVQTIY